MILKIEIKEVVGFDGRKGVRTKLDNLVLGTPLEIKVGLKVAEAINAALNADPLGGGCVQDEPFKTSVRRVGNG